MRSATTTLSRRSVGYERLKLVSFIDVEQQPPRIHNAFLGNSFVIAAVLVVAVKGVKVCYHPSCLVVDVAKLAAGYFTFSIACTRVCACNLRD